MLINTLSEQPISSLLDDDKVLLALPYGSDCKPGIPGVVSSGLTALGSQSPQTQSLQVESPQEVWSVSNGKVTRDSSGNCHWSCATEVLAAAVWLSHEDCQNLEAATARAYTELLTLLRKQDYPYPFRFWNYLPAINHGEGDQENYKLFCNGRLSAFREMAISEKHFASASALGHHGDGAVIYVLAAKQPGQHHSNSLQVNAYQYPREYGISSPSFSRATAITLGQQELFFISGTASIIGHKTAHQGNLNGQLRTTIDNIRHLLANTSTAQPTLQSMKVYLRHASDYENAQQILHNEFPETTLLFTQADICRKNLLVEVECFCG